VLNFDAIAIGSWWYPGYEMTEAPRLSEEARISPMIEEKRGTQIHTGAARGRRDERRSEKRWTRGRVGRSIPIGVHARRSPRRYREMAGI